jgi:hypothetical protein
LLEDGAVGVEWPGGAERPFDLSAIYRWRDAVTLDLETRVQAAQDLPGFEVFLASYFSEGFTNCLVRIQYDPDRGGTSGTVAAVKSAGDWQMFPRDEAAVALITDGRWKLEPNPVAWTLRPELRLPPTAIRRDSVHGITATLSGDKNGCFAIGTPYETEGHYSVYLALFGRNLKAGETARARTHLRIQGSKQPAPLPRRQE